MSTCRKQACDFMGCDEFHREGCKEMAQELETAEARGRAAQSAPSPALPSLASLHALAKDWNALATMTTIADATILARCARELREALAKLPVTG